jgi:hypothetical protein
VVECGGVEAGRGRVAVAEFGVAVLGGAAEDLEGTFGGTALLAEIVQLERVKATGLPGGLPCLPVHSIRKAFNSRSAEPGRLRGVVPNLTDDYLTQTTI